MISYDNTTRSGSEPRQECNTLRGGANQAGRNEAGRNKAGARGRFERPGQGQGAPCLDRRSEDHNEVSKACRFKDRDSDGETLYAGGS